MVQVVVQVTEMVRVLYKWICLCQFVLASCLDVCTSCNVLCMPAAALSTTRSARQGWPEVKEVSIKAISQKVRLLGRDD
jgi:hypothetical protein